MRADLPICLAAFAFLTGCGLTERTAPETAPVSAPSEEGQVAAPPTVPAPPVKPPHPKTPVAKPLPKPVYTPDELVGLDRDGIIKLLGEPSESRSESGAQVLTYRAKNCTLAVLLFLDVKAGSERVLSYDLSPAAHNGKSCYSELRSVK